MPWLIRTDHVGVVGGTGPDRISLNRKKGGTVQLEVHKMRDGSTRIVGYVFEADFRRLIQVDRPPIEVLFLCEHFRDYTKIISIPIERIVESIDRSIADDSHPGYIIDLTVS